MEGTKYMAKRKLDTIGVTIRMGAKHTMMITGMHPSTALVFNAHDKLGFETYVHNVFHEARSAYRKGKRE